MYLLCPTNLCNVSIILNETATFLNENFWKWITQVLSEYLYNDKMSEWIKQSKKA